MITNVLPPFLWFTVYVLSSHFTCKGRWRLIVLKTVRMFYVFTVWTDLKHIKYGSKPVLFNAAYIDCRLLTSFE